jgi:hypothetical protein
LLVLVLPISGSLWLVFIYKYSSGWANTSNTNIYLYQSIYCVYIIYQDTQRCGQTLNHFLLSTDLHVWLIDIIIVTFQLNVYVQIKFIHVITNVHYLLFTIEII